MYKRWTEAYENPIATLENYNSISLQQIHNNTEEVNMSDELPEQEIIFDYLPRDSKVLELGGNIGRSSIIISNILNNPLQHVVVESDPSIANKLKHNRDINNLKFQMEVGAISNKKMIQSNWNTKVLDTDTIPKGWKEIPTITLKNLYNKYNINFDTIVADCEGCLFQILKDNLWILPQIKNIILENDFDKSEFVKFLKENGFSSKYCRDGVNIPKKFDNKCFYQVWTK
jgi:FkbM family methyltransferase